MKGEYAEVCGQLGDQRKQRRIRRIEEYEKFLTNCNVVRGRLEVERMARSRERRKRRNTVVAARKTKPEYVLRLRSSSLSHLDVLQSQDFSEERRSDRFSMPPLPDYNQDRPVLVSTSPTTPREIKYRNLNKTQHH